MYHLKSWMPHFLFSLHYLRYNCLKVTRFYFNLLLHKQLPLSIRAISRHRREKKKNHRYLSFYHLMSLGWLKSFQVGVLGVLVCVPFPRAGRAHGGLSFEPVGEKGKNVPPDQPDWFFSNVSLLCFRASVLLPYELDRNTK